MQMPSDQAPVHQTGTQWSDSIYIEDVRNSSNFANYKLLLHTPEGELQGILAIIRSRLKDFMAMLSDVCQPFENRLGVLG